jgi:hypothetical protein
MGSILRDVELEQASERCGRVRVDSVFARGDDGRFFGTLSDRQ